MSDPKNWNFQKKNASIEKNREMPIGYKIFYGAFGLLLLFFLGLAVHEIYTWDDYNRWDGCTLSEVDEDGYVWRTCTSAEKIQSDSRHAQPEFNR